MRNVTRSEKNLLLILQQHHLETLDVAHALNDVSMCSENTVNFKVSLLDLDQD